MEGRWRACVTPGSVRRLPLWMENRLKSRDGTQSGWIGERERLLSEPANRSQTDLTTCPHIYLLFAVFSVQQVRNFMEGENSRWKDDQCEPTENQRGNSDVQIDNVVFV